MEYKIHVRDRYGKRAPMPPRTITFDPERDSWPPKCPWCRIRKLDPVGDVIAHGLTVDLVHTLARCSGNLCDNTGGTVIVYHVKHGERDYRYPTSKQRKSTGEPTKGKLTE